MTDKDPVGAMPSGGASPTTVGRDFGVPPEVRDLADRLLPLYYEEVRRLARSVRRRTGAGETLQTTALIHEAYLRLRNHPGFADRLHFLRSSSLAMRHALINHAASNLTAKRGGGTPRLSLEQVSEPAVDTDEGLLALNEALERLSSRDPRLCQVVECRFFAGYTVDETAEILELSRRTVIRDWIKARAWLYRELAARV